MTFQPEWFSLFTPIMDAEEDGEGACRQQFFAELFFVLKHRMIFSEVLPQAAIDVTGDGGVNQFCNARILRDSVTSIAPLPIPDTNVEH